MNSAEMGDEVLDQVLLFYLGEAWTGMTDVGEVLETASRIKVKDSRSWAREWRRTAERLDAAASATEAAGHGHSAGGAACARQAITAPRFIATWTPTPKKSRN